MRQSILRTVFSITLLTLLLPAQAIVNVEDLHLKQSDKPFIAKLNLDVSGASGNTDKFNAKAGLRLEWFKDNYNRFLTLDHNYGESRNVQDTEATYIHLRHIQHHDDKLSYEAFAQLERNEFARLSLRSLLGGGIRYQLIDIKDTTTAYLGLSLFYAKEDLIDSATTTDSDSTDWWGNTYFIIKHAVSEQVQVQSTTYVQPNLSGGSDFRMIEQASLNFLINEQMSLKLKLNIKHDSEPPQNVRKTDTTYLTGIEYRF